MAIGICLFFLVLILAFYIFTYFCPFFVVFNFIYVNIYKIFTKTLNYVVVSYLLMLFFISPLMILARGLLYLNPCFVNHLYCIQGVCVFLSCSLGNISLNFMQGTWMKDYIPAFLQLGLVIWLKSCQYVIRGNDVS